MKNKEKLIIHIVMAVCSVAMAAMHFDMDMDLTAFGFLWMLCYCLGNFFWSLADYLRENMDKETDL